MKVSFPDMTSVNERTMNEAKSARAKVSQKLVDLLKDRFESFNDNVFSQMSWCSPEQWTNEMDYGVEEIQSLANHFEVPFLKAGFDPSKWRLEWKNLQRYAKMYMLGKEANQLWKSIVVYKQKEYPNLCLLVELILCLSGSNSAVERAFSVLTMMLSDRRLKTSHKLMNMRLTIKINDKNWSEIEREEIIKRALDIYMSKKSRKRKVAPEISSTSCTSESISIDTSSESEISDSADDDLDDNNESMDSDVGDI